jgi:hypothetical protein
MSRAPRVVFAGLAAAVVAVVPTTAAQAATQDMSINLGSGWVHDSATPLFAVTGFAPGFSQTQTLLVRNDTTDAGNLALSADNIVENENGCMHSEAVVDFTCGATQGELGHELLFSVFLDPENDGSYEAAPTWTGTLYDLTTPTSLLNGIPGGGIVGLKVDMALPFSSGNETQTDDVDFSFRLSLAGTGSPDTPGGTTSGSGGPSAGSGPVSTPQGPGSVEVKGIKVTRHPHHNVLHDIASDLPFTGSPIERLVAGGLWLLVAGTALTLLAASRRRRMVQD